MDIKTTFHIQYNLTSNLHDRSFLMLTSLMLLLQVFEQFMSQQFVHLFWAVNTARHRVFELFISTIKVKITPVLMHILLLPYI